jgi:hypothetical protein
MTAPAFIYTSEPWPPFSLGGLFFRPSVHAGANECGVLFRVEHFLHSQQLGICLLFRKETQKIFALFLSRDFLNFPAGSGANP